MRKNLIRSFVWGVLLDLIGPYATWRLVSTWWPLADLRGPYLVASPFIALTLVFLPISYLFGLRYLDNQGGGDETEGPLGRASQEFAGRAGLTGVRLVEDPKRHLWAVQGEKRIRVEMDQWERLGQDEREFAVARAVASLLAKPKRWYAWLPTTIAQLGGMAIASLNLWLVLAVHASWGAYLGVGVPLSMRRRTYETDREALKLTRNLDGAIGFVRRQTNMAVFGIDTEQRVRMLRATYEGR